MKHHSHNTQQGMALFIAVIAVSALLLISFSIADISYKQQVITFSGRESKGAFYAADSGLECALYHDLKVESFFPTNSSAGTVLDDVVKCDDRVFDATVSPTTPVVGGFSTTTTHFGLAPNYGVNFDGGSTCVKVDVDKVVGPDDVSTHVRAYGYNTTCENLANDSLRNVERALEVNY